MSHSGETLLLLCRIKSLFRWEDSYQIPWLYNYPIILFTRTYHQILDLIANSSVRIYMHISEVPVTRAATINNQNRLHLIKIVGIEFHHQLVANFMLEVLTFKNFFDI